VHYLLTASQLATAPFEYVASLPSKEVRGTIIDALNLWCELPDATLSQIKEVIDELHNASLMLDDIEDGSDLRRAHVAAHAVFGVPQTINAGLSPSWTLSAKHTRFRYQMLLALWWLTFGTCMSVIATTSIGPGMRRVHLWTSISRWW